MTSSSPITWPSLVSHYSAPEWHSLAQLARDYYAQQGRLTTAAQFLRLPPNAAAEPFVGNSAAHQLIVAALPSPGRPDETYDQFVARGSASARPVLKALVEVLAERGVTPAGFRDSLAMEDAGPYLRALLSPSFWTSVVREWRRQVQRRIDTEGRTQRFAAAGDNKQQAARKAAYEQLAAARPADSLESLSELPLNQIARELWNAKGTGDNPLVDQLLTMLEGAARLVVNQNFPEDELEARLLTALPSEWLASAEALLLPDAKGKPPVTTAGELASAKAGALATRVRALPANHPVVYALARWVQSSIQRFLEAEPRVASSPPPTSVPVRGQLLGEDGVPLPGFTLQFVQELASRAGVERALGSLQTDGAGRFTLTMPLDLYLDDSDAVATATPALRVSVHRPGQSPADKAGLTMPFPLPADGSEVVLRTDLSPVPAAPASTEVAALSEDLPKSLQQLLAENNVSTLAAIRQAGGLQRLARDRFAKDPAAARAARRLDGLARLEVVSPDVDLLERVVRADFYSPAELLDSTTADEFVQRVAGDSTADEDLPKRARAFYRQAAATHALSQALGLTATNNDQARFPSAAATTRGQQRKAPAQEEESSFSSFAQASSEPGSFEEGAAAVSQDESSFATPGDSSSARLANHTVTDGYNVTPSGVPLAYAAEGQCDCPACRSAVSPTAYLAALLKYATDYLRSPGSATTRFSPKQLQEKFLQPFCDLGVSCQSADETVCQYRLAIEVIQSYWRTRTTPGAALTLAQAQPYVENVLEALLQALGTSLGELRGMTAVTQPDLATRLQLPPAVLDLLQTRFSPSQLAGARSLDEVEADLAEVFGLASTAVDPLRSGLLLTPSAGTDPIALVRWSLQGIEYGLNTDPEGQLRVEIAPEVTKEHRVTVYAGQLAEDNVVARGVLRESDATTNTFTGLLHPQHGSGLRGSLVATVTGSAPATFTLAMVAAITAGRQQTLAASWLRDDAAAIDLLQAHQAPSWNGFTFLVDPDLLGPDDFRPLQRTQPHSGNRAYQLWRRRYTFLQHQLLPGLLAVDNPAEGVVYTYGGYEGNGVNPELLASGDEMEVVVEGSTSTLLGRLLDALPTHSLTYRGADGSVYTRIPWRTSDYTGYANGYRTAPTGTAALAALHGDLAGEATASTLATKVLTSIGLSAEAFERLHGLWQLSRTQTLSDADFQEALDIVRQSVKKRFGHDWTIEERDRSPVQLDTLLFQSALHEPQPGIWEQLRPKEFGLETVALPQVDPDETTPLELPDASFGDLASTLWRARQGEMLQKRQAIVASGGTATAPELRADAMLRYAYRVNRHAPAPTAVLPGVPPAALTTLEKVWAAAQNKLHPDHVAAAAYQETTLCLRAAEVTRLVELREQALTQAGDAIWQEMAAVLALGWKRAVAYRQSYVSENTAAPAAGSTVTLTSSWRVQETPNGEPAPLDRLIATRKHHLVKWRASAARRAAWVQALALAGQRPLIDPDQLVPGDFRQAGERSRNQYYPVLADHSKPYLNPAFDLYAQRVEQVQGWYNVVQTNWSGIQNLSDAEIRYSSRYQLVADLLYCTPAELRELRAQMDANVDVKAPLRRLGLTSAGLHLIVNQLENPSRDRSPEMLHLLVQVQRQRQYADWAREEIAASIVPGPRYFRAPQAEAETLAKLPWRSSAVARRQWQRTLSARFGQADALTAAQQQAVRTAEDQHLPLLRDALLAAKVGTPSETNTARAKALEQEYKIDFQAICCQNSTRVGQAIEVLQKIFLELRGGLAANDQTLATAGTTFEQDWQWLSSYERWRSLMFLYLYPQNVLLPALKPGQSSQFRQTVRAIRQATSLSPVGAREYMDAYQAFLTDMESLQVQAAVQTTLSPRSTDGFQGAEDAQPVSLHVAVSANKIAYANLYDLDASGATENNYSWTRLPGAAQVSKVVGAAVYRPTSGERYAYVFALLLEEQKDTVTNPYADKPAYLAFQRFSLRTLSWDEDYTRFSNSDSATLDPNNVVLAHGIDEAWAPAVLGLRNKRTPLLTDAPFSQTATGYDLGLQTVLGDYSSYVDLFTAVVDAAGTGLGREQVATFFLIKDAALIGAVRQNNTTIVCATALQAGKDVMTSGYQREEIPYLHTLHIDLASERTKPRYIFNINLMRDGSTQNATSVSGDIYSNEYFRSSYRGSLFNNVMSNLRTVISFQRGDFDGAITTRGVATVENSNGDYLLPLVDTNGDSTLASSPAAGLRMTGPPTNSVRVANNLAIYYNRRLRNNFELKTYRISLFLYTFTNIIAVGADDITDSAGNAISEVFNSTIANPGQEYRFIGPAVCNTASLAPSPTFSTLYEVISQVGAQATLRLSATSTALLCGMLPVLPPLFSPLTASGLADRSGKLQTINGNPATALDTPGFVQTLLSEAYYTLPMLLAQELMRGRNYELALHYYRLVYDYTRVATTATPDATRLIYPALISASAGTYDSALAWLQNPNNPYTLAGLRPNSHLEYVVMSVVRCLLAYADDEFTRDTAESVSRARTYYELAARLLKQDITQHAVPGTGALLDPLDAMFPLQWLGEWQSLKAVLARVNQRAVLEQVLRLAEVEGVANRGLLWLVGQAQTSFKSWPDAFNQAWQLVNGQLAALPGGYISLCATTGSAATATTPTLPAGTLPTSSVRPYVPFLGANFCVPTNPVPFALALRAELNLYKIRSCRNIAGIQREIDPYAAATDNVTGLPTVSGSGQLVRNGRLVVPATQFRYAYIMERARNLVALAQQTESSLLSALEKRDAEAYNLLKARQDIAVSQATVQLQSLRITEAEDGVDLAGLQLERSEITQQQYDEWLSEGLNGWEEAQLVAIVVAGAARVVAAAVTSTNVFDAVASFGGSVVAAAANAVAAAAETTAQFSGIKASYERRENEWRFQRNLSAQDIKIGQQQIRIASDQLKVVGQEKRISQLQLDHASTVLNFLTTKFTNAELYDWMSGILEGAYGYFLQQATATARLAQQQLAFERQEAPAGIVQEDYYSAPADDVTSASLVTEGGTSGTDRKGLTGSVRLLQDLTRLDEYAFETTRRKLQLTKTISLAQNFPTEFVRFRDTGVLAFACQPEWFDQDFPGQYLRIVRRVRTSVIALVPPVEGIKARLSTSGTSHVTVNGAPFQTLALPRAPEGVALTSPANATGLFELEPQSTELLYPFEGLGVDVPWTFSMQPASNSSLDYSAIADVLVTLEYTAMENADYARQVVQQLGTERRQVVALSMRNRFADQWYDLHHADDVAPADRHVARLTVAASDLPLHLRNARVNEISLFVDAPLDEDGGAFSDRSQLELSLSRGASTSSSAFTNQYGLISTRTGTGPGPLYTGNAGSFVSLLGAAPAGEWVLTVAPGRLRDRLAAGLVNDIYLIVEVEGDAPAYIL